MRCGCCAVIAAQPAEQRGPERRGDDKSRLHPGIYWQQEDDRIQKEGLKTKSHLGAALDNVSVAVHRYMLTTFQCFLLPCSQPPGDLCGGSHSDCTASGQVCSRWCVRHVGPWTACLYFFVVFLCSIDCLADALCYDDPFFVHYSIILFDIAVLANAWSVDPWSGFYFSHPVLDVAWLHCDAQISDSHFLCMVRPDFCMCCVASQDLISGLTVLKCSY